MKLTLGNSTCRIEETTLEEFTKLRELLSYTVPEVYGSSYGPSKRCLLTKRGEFPSGLRHHVAAFINAYKSNMAVIDERVRPTPNPDMFSLKLKGIVPYPAQREAVQAALDNGRGAISMPTGSGKSITMALLIAMMGMRTLVIVPNLGLKQQLTSTFKALLGDSKNVVVENIDSPKLKTLTNFDCLIIDESHHSAAATYRKLNKTAWAGIYHRFCFTATHYRSNEEETMLMEAITGPLIYKLTYWDAVANGFVVPVEAYYFDLPKQPVPENEYSWSSVYSQLVVNNDYRNGLISELLFTVADVPSICLVKEIKHGQMLSDATGIPFANGEDGNARRHILEFVLGETKGLIGTTGVLGEGVDTKPAEYVILAGAGKSRNQFMQSVGRAMRTSIGKDTAKVILFRDASHPWLLKHYNAQVKYLREEFGVKPVKLELPKEKK